MELGSGAIRALRFSGQQKLVNKSAASRMIKAPGMTRANANPKKGVICIISDTSADEAALDR
jgi:hypothetical protein